MKKINYLMLITLALLLYNCRSEVLENNEEQAAHPHTTQKTTATIKDFPEFKQFIIENHGKLHLPQSVASKNGSENNDEVKVLQIKTLKRTSYNMLYDVEESGFSILAHTIDQQNNESSFIAKYVSRFTDKNLRIEDFTGTIYYEDINGKSLGSVEMINGSPVQTYSSHPGTTSKVDCSYVPIVIAVRCNLAEHHLPGEAGCLATGDDMPYYTIDFQLKCSQGQYGASGLAGGDIAAGGGGPGLLLGSARIEFFLLNIPDAPYLTDEQRNFLDANNTMIPIANRLGMYLKNNQNVQAANFVLWAVDFFKDNPNTTWSQFEDSFLKNTPDGFLQQIILENPATILNYETLSSPNFKMRKIDQIKYPNFTTVVKNLKTEIQNNPNTLNRLVELTGLTESQVLGNLTFGQGPSIRLVPNLTGPSGPNYGNFNPADPTFINIKLEFVLGLEQASLSSTRHATAFLLAVTILHEFIHFGNYISGYDTNGNEMGNIFEYETYGFTITHLNAGYYIIQLK